MTIDNRIFSSCPKLERVELPATVVSIGERAFENCSSLSSIEIPLSVNSIGSFAFSGCSSLSSITIPDAVTSLSDGAFSDCDVLVEFLAQTNSTIYKSVDGVLYSIDSNSLVLFPPGKKDAFTIPDFVTSIGDSAFYGCKNLTAITIPNSVTKIGKSAFSGCSALTSVVLSDAITQIAANTFLGCTALTSIKIPDAVQMIAPGAFENCSALSEVLFGSSSSLSNIGDYAFRSCSALSSIIIPDTVEGFGYSTFKGCDMLNEIGAPDGSTKWQSIDGVLYDIQSNSLALYPPAKKGDFVIPSTVTAIGVGAFSSSSYLTAVEIPESVTAIHSYAFLYCKTLKSLNIPDGVSYIGEWSIAGCDSIATLTIGKNVEGINNYAFAICKGLKNIYSLAKTPLECRNYVFMNAPTYTAMVYVPAGAKDLYTSANGWRDFMNYTEMGKIDISLNEVKVELYPNQTVTLTATVDKEEEVTIESEAWATSDADIVSVDNGLVSAHSAGSATITYIAVDGYGLSHTARCAVEVLPASGLEEAGIGGDDTACRFFNLSGAPVDVKKLTPGIYIKLSNGKASKVTVR